MPLSNAQYDEIMHEYDERQLHNRHILETRRAEVLKKLPRLKEIDASVASSSVRQARLHLDGDTNALASLKQELSALSLERQQLLTASGYPADYLDPVYTCPDCKDSGYIDGKKCHCFKQAIINTVYAQSNIRQILRIENFDNFRYDFYSKEEKNLLFYGKTGVGKTFLTNCVAKELLDHGYSVIYFTAFQLFDILSKGVFEKDSDAIATHQNIFDCDLLVIDDLGTELINSFTSSQLFLCVNERLIRQKSTIISTNLSVERIKESYSERTFSRILDSYTFINLFTEEDIRKQKRTRIISR